MGNTTSYTYLDDGLTASVKRTSFDGTKSYVLESDTYDAAGNLLTSTSDNGETVTNYKVDAASRTTSTTVDPTGVDRVSTVSYTPDDQVASQNDHDATGYDRTTASTYDAMGNVLAGTRCTGTPPGTRPAGGTEPGLRHQHHRLLRHRQHRHRRIGRDLVGQRGEVRGHHHRHRQRHRHHRPGPGHHRLLHGLRLGQPQRHLHLPHLRRAGRHQPGLLLPAVLEGGQRVPLPRGQRRRGLSDRVLRRHRHRGTHAEHLDTPGRRLRLDDRLHEAVRQQRPAGSGTDTAPWTGTGPLSIGGTEKADGTTSDIIAGSVGDVQVYQRALSATDVTSLYGKGRTGGTVGSSTQQTTKYTYDKRGLPTSTTDARAEHHDVRLRRGRQPRGLHRARRPGPDPDGTTAATVHPVTTSGFNTFGEGVEEEDPNGLVTTTAYDANGNKVSEALPSYTPAGASTPNAGTTVWKYDSEGNRTDEISPSGKTTSYLYDQMGNLAQITAPDGTKTHALYDTNGEQLSATDAAGAQTQATYDFMGRRLTSTTMERYPSTRTLATTNSYAVTTGNPYGAHTASTTSPGGVANTYAYNRAGDITSVTDGAGNPTRYGYDFEGNTTTLADGTWTETDYNASDDPTATREYDANGAVLSSTSQQYDGVGDLTASTDANQHTTRWTYDASGAITQQVESVDASTSITTTFGYDAAGNRTRFTDGRGNSWRYTYTPWGQQEKVIEPTTATYTSAADSTTTFAYDADGQPTTATLPGGVTTSMTYDVNGRLKTMSGAGADAATAKRSFNYDADGRVLFGGHGRGGHRGRGGPPGRHARRVHVRRQG